MGRPGHQQNAVQEIVTTDQGCCGDNWPIHFIFHENTKKEKTLSTSFKKSHFFKLTDLIPSFLSPCPGCLRLVGRCPFRQLSNMTQLPVICTKKFLRARIKSGHYLIWSWRMWQTPYCEVRKFFFLCFLVTPFLQLTLIGQKPLWTPKK